jgi:hypothetical protein
LLIDSEKNKVNSWYAKYCMAFKSELGSINEIDYVRRICRLGVILTFILNSFCKPANLSNICDPNSDSNKLTLLTKLLTGDESPFCGIDYRKPASTRVPNICQIPYWEVSKPENWNLLEAYFIAKLSVGEKEIQNVYTIQIPNLSFANKNIYTAGLMPNGKIIALPSNESGGLLILDPKDDSIERITIAESMNVTGFLLGRDGKIYGQPGTIGKMLIFDPETKAFSFKTIPSSSIGNSFQGGAAIGDNLYMVNRLGSKVLKYNLTTETFTEIDVLPNYVAGGVNFVGASLTKDGRIFGTPANQTSLLVIDPKLDTARIDIITNVAASVTIRNFEGATIGPKGEVFMFPRAANGVLKVNPETNQFTLLDSISPSLSTYSAGKYITGELTPSGKIISPPYVGNTTNLLITNSATSEISYGSKIVPDLTAANPSYIGSVLAPNKKLYFFSLSGYPILVVDIGDTFCDSVLLSTYLNNN